MTHMLYRDAMSYLTGLQRFGSRPGLSRATALNKALGDPQNALSVVHVAGTNGKGSTSTMIAAALTAAGYKTGLYTSPSVERFEERIRIDGAMIGEDEVAEGVAAVRRTVETLLAAGVEHPTEFEVVTALAFSYFKRKGCDAVVLETGLGGRFDATNTVATPLLAVLTSISMDHMVQLGGTIAAIAGEKCGIIKPGVPVVCYPRQPAEAMAVIERDCAAKNAPLFVPRRESLHMIRELPGELVFAYQNAVYRMAQTGRHFAENALVALAALDVLRGKGFSISGENAQAGVAAVLPAGRMEMLCKAPAVLLDGAHNADGIRRLTETLDTVFAGRRLVSVMGMYQDKDFAACIPAIARRSHVFLATSPGTARALPASRAREVAAAAGVGALRAVEGVALAREDAAEAAAEGFRLLTGGNDVLLCCGSFGLIRASKERLSALLAGFNNF